MPWLLRDDEVLATLEVADDCRSRTGGLLGRDGCDGALLLQPARSVHTIGMRFAIDVAYCDGDLRVLRVVTMRPPPPRSSLSEGPLRHRGGGGRLRPLGAAAGRSARDPGVGPWPAPWSSSGPRSATSATSRPGRSRSWPGPTSWPVRTADGPDASCSTPACGPGSCWWSTTTTRPSGWARSSTAWPGGSGSRWSPTRACPGSATRGSAWSGPRPGTATPSRSYPVPRPPSPPWWPAACPRPASCSRGSCPARRAPGASAWPSWSTTSGRWSSTRRPTGWPPPWPTCPRCSGPGVGSPWPGS